MELDMQNENPNNFHWKNKLDDTDSLPGEGIADKNAAWEKLHARLGGQPRRKIAIWYWAAASILLLVLMAVLVPRPATTELATNNGQVTAPKKPANQNPANAVAETANVVSTVPKTSIPQQVHVQPRKIETTVENVPTNNVLVNNNTAENTVTVPPVLQLLSVADTSAKILAMAPVKKKLKVVHINELGDPLPQQPAMAKTADYHTFQLKIMSQEMYGSQIITSDNSTLNIFKSKNTPTN
jgi:hypothetical protein